jgi:hypothetical protein
MNDKSGVSRARTRAVLGPLAIAALLQGNPGASHAQTRVRDLDNPARQPFQAELEGLTFNTLADAETFQVAVVPAGKRFVIEHVSLRVDSLEATAGGAPQPRFRSFATLAVKADGVPARHELVVNRADVGGSSVNLASQPIRAYADPGSLVWVEIDAADDDGGDSLLRVAHVTISGHLVDLP